MSWRNTLRNWLPPIGLQFLNRFRPRVKFEGSYPNWAAAAARAEGYDDQAVLTAVAAATREVLAGRAVFERDSRLFFEEEPNYPLLAGLLLAGRGGELRIVDFGGALGSVYFQNRRWLREIGVRRWTVVEQPHFVELGMREFSVGELGFAVNLAAAQAAMGGVDAVLFSSVLQYLPEPWTVLEEAAALRTPFILIDRTPLRLGQMESRIAVQQVPKSLHAARYPVRFLGEMDLHLRLEALGYRRIDAFNSYEIVIELPDEPQAIPYRGEVWRRQEDGSY